MKRKDALWVMQMCRDRDARSEAEIEAFDTAIEALKSESIFTADRPRGEWIPVSEKLPREDQKCLVCHKGAIGIDEFIGHDLPYKWRIYLRDYDAWMPLPEPFCGADMRGDGK